MSSRPGRNILTERVDLFDSTYGHFTDRVLDAIRKETFGVDIGQNSWLTVDEYKGEAVRNAGLPAN